MKNKYIFVIVMLAVILAAGVGLTTGYVKHQEQVAEQDEFLVVTSFYPMYVAAENVIGDCDGVKLENLSEPQTGCLHDYQLTSEDMKLLSKADVFIVNGGGIETFLSDVAEQYPDLKIVNASEDVDLLDDNAHAWMNMSDYMKQVKTIRDGLSESDPGHTQVYKEHAASYLQKVQNLMGEAHALEHSMQGQSVVIFHEAYAYVAKEFGAKIAGVMDLDEERQVSAGEVADILKAIRENNVSVVLAEELYGKDMGTTVQKESGVKVLYLDTLVRGDGSPDSYLDGMRKNIEMLKEAFPGGEHAHDQEEDSHEDEEEHAHEHEEEETAND